MYFQSNSASEDTVLLIHGWAGSRKAWDYVVPRLAARWKVIQPDLWGHGDSSAPDVYLTPDQMACDLEKVLTAAGSTDCYLVAHSMGCAIALAFAKYLPRKVKGLILIEGIYPLKEMFASAGKSIDDETRKSIFEQMLSPYSQEPWALDLMHTMMKVPQRVLEQYAGFLSMDRVELLKKLSSPTAIISREYYNGTLLVDDYWHQLGLKPSLILRIPDTKTHFVIQEQPARSTECIMNALDSVKAEADNRLKQSVEHFFSKQAEMYFNSQMHAEELLTEVVEILEPDVDHIAVDLGCGAGHTTFAISPRVREVRAVDHSAKMLEIVEREVVSRGLSNVKPMLSDVESLNFPDSSIHRITSRIAAHHFPNLRKVLAEASRVLTPDGILVIVDNTAPADADLYAFTDEMEKLKDSSHFHLYPERAWREMLAEAGLTIDYLRYYKAKHSFLEWTGVAGLSPNVIEDLRQRFLAATPKIAKYFEIRKDGNEITTFCIDRLILRAKPR